MTISCRVCGKQAASDLEMRQGSITNGMCEACAHEVCAGNSEILDSIEAPVLLMQGDPRQVVTANRSALKLFRKELCDVEGQRGGVVFDCIHAFTETCGEGMHCEHCTIRNAIVDTFVTANPHSGVTTELSVMKSGEIKTHVLEVSTEKLGDLALVRINRYGADSVPQ